MIKTSKMIEFFSTLNINPQTKYDCVIEKILTLPKVNRKFICAQLASFNDLVFKGNKKYKLELSLEKDYVKVLLKDPVLYATNPSEGLLNVTSKFYLYQLNVDHSIGVQI